MSAPLYQEIAESIRQAIFYGELSPGDELPAVRDMSQQWDCAPGTVQRAYRELSRQGLITSRPGQGTRVTGSPVVDQASSFRQAALANEVEAFLLRVLASGYTPDDVGRALQLALDRWRALSENAPSAPPDVLRFVGSHDPSLARIADHLGTLAPETQLSVSFAGSLGGLIALTEGNADIAGSHLWDEATDTYNVPFVQRLLPGRRVALLTLAHRRLGLIVAPGNPAGIHDLRDLARDGVRMINRQAGAGTRVWLDAQLRRLDLSPAAIAGYDDVVMTHSDVAHAVAEGRADAGIGIEAAAVGYGVGFVFLTRERYDFVIPGVLLDHALVQRLAAWLATDDARALLQQSPGYDVDHTGRVEWVNA